MTAPGGGRGGYRQPANPAAVSNPQSGARTDGGAGSQEQPLRVPTGGAYGQRQAAVQQQQGAPLAGGGPGVLPGAGPGGGAAPPGILPPGMAGGVFGPSTSPGVAASGSIAPGEMIAQNPQMFLRVLATKFPHPALRRLVDWSAAGSTPPRGTQLTPQQGPPTTDSMRGAAPTPPPQGSPTSPPTAPGVATAEGMPSPQQAARQGP